MVPAAERERRVSNMKREGCLENTCLCHDETSNLSVGFHCSHCGCRVVEVTAADEFANACRDALSISQGACNPRGISRALVRAIDAGCDASGKGHDGVKDAKFGAPARLILEQLIFLLGGSVTWPDGVLQFGRDTEACEEITKGQNPAIVAGKSSKPS